MPYIDQEARVRLADIGSDPETAGELNYLITRTCTNYATLRGHRYTTYNEIVGVLECAKLEMYRRLIGPYEDTKIEENGDVY